MYRLRWHPTGLYVYNLICFINNHKCFSLFNSLPDIWVKKSQLEDNRTRKVSIDSLPNTWQRSILSNRKKRSLTSSPKTCRTRQSTKKLKQQKTDRKVSFLHETIAKSQELISARQHCLRPYSSIFFSFQLSRGLRKTQFELLK